MSAAVVVGARNLGRAIAARLAADGWDVAGVARSDQSLEGLPDLGVVPLRGDASDPAQVDRVLAQARERFGGLDLVVNAASASRRAEGPFGGGPVADATLDGFRGWSTAVAEQGFVMVSRGAAALRDAGGGALIQVVGGSSRRALPGRGPWAAGQFAVRALVHAAAQELRAEGVHVALLVVDATIESPKTAAFTRDAPREALADQADVAAAVVYLAGQSPRGISHELVLTPAGDRWTP